MQLKQTISHRNLTKLAHKMPSAPAAVAISSEFQATSTTACSATKAPNAEMICMCHIEGGMPSASEQVQQRQCNTLKFPNHGSNITDNSGCARVVDIGDGCGGGCCCTADMRRNENCIRCNDKSCNFNFNFKNLNGIFVFAVVLLLFTWCDLTNAALTNVNLYIEPPAVRRGQSVLMRCNYNLTGAPLYSVKFYRGQLEFFRYTPGEYPNTKVFPYPGIRVDESASNATQVVIRNVGFGLSGNFSCEVTADAPLYSTATTYAQMQVVEFPEKRPLLFTEQTRYEPGDILRANCSTPPSRPRAELRFSINNIPIPSDETQFIRTIDNLTVSRLSLKMKLQAIHFGGGTSSTHMINAYGNNNNNNNNNNAFGVPYNTFNTINGGVPTGSLILRCTAQIGDLYQEYKEIELGTPQKDPVPARVTLSSGSSLTNFFEKYFSSSTSSSPPTRSQPAGLRTWLTISVAAGAIFAFHLLPLFGCR